MPDSVPAMVLLLGYSLQHDVTKEEEAEEGEAEATGRRAMQNSSSLLVLCGMTA